MNKIISIMWLICLSIGFDLSAQSTDTIEIKLKTLDEIAKAKYLCQIANQYLHISLPKALQYAKEALEIAQKAKNDTLQITANNQIAGVYFQQANYEKALDIYLSTLKISEKISHVKSISNLNNNIGNVFFMKNNYPKAIEYYEKSLEIDQKLGDDAGVGDSYSNLANIYNNQKNYSKSLDYFQKALKLYQKLDNQESIATTLNNLGKTYFDQKEFDQALENYQKALEINQKLAIDENIAHNLQNIGSVYLYKSEVENAIKSFLRSNQIGKEYRFLVKDNFEYLAQAYAQIKKFEQAYEYQQKFITLKDSIFSKESEQKIAELQTQYETSQKEQQIELLKKNNNIQQLEISQKNITVYTSLIIILLVLGLAFLFYNRFRLKNRSNILLTAANTEIRQSVVEKEVLLQEVHHRVKNNLQLISSLLGWQAEQIQDEKMLRLIDESKMRIQSMALIHENLYRSQNLAQVNVADYLQNLIHHIQKSFADERKIEIKFQIEPFLLTAESIIPIGLIVNELVSNAYKYAFENTENASIEIVFQKIDDQYILTVQDNGHGLPPDYEEKMKGSLGLQLVQILTKQLRGSLKIQIKDPTCFEIVF